MTKSLFIFIHFMAFLNVSYSQVPLDSLFKMAERNSSNIQNTKLDVTISNLKERKIKASLLPSLELGVNQNLIYGLSFDQISGTLSKGNSWSRYLSSNATANISSRDILSYTGQIKIARLSKQIAVNSVTSHKIELRNIVTLLYFEILKYTEMLPELERQLSRMESVFERDSLLFTLGKRSREDVLIGKMRIVETKGYIDSLELSNKNLLLKLKTLCGTQLTISNSEYSIESMDGGKKNPIAILFGSQQLLEKESPTIIENQLMSQSFQLEMKSEKLSFLPEIVFSTTYGTSFSSLNFDQTLIKVKPFSAQVSDNKFFQYYMAIRYPISNLYKNKGKIKEREIEICQNNNYIKELKRDTESKKHELRLDLINKYNSISKMETQIKTLHEIYSIKEKKYEIGLLGREDLEKTSQELDGLVLRVKSEKLNLLCGIELYKNTFFYEN